MIVPFDRLCVTLTLLAITTFTLLSQWYTFDICWETNVATAECSTNAEQCIMWYWMLKYAIQHVESCWTLLNENRAWLYSLQHLVPLVATCWTTSRNRFLRFVRVSRGFVERSNTAGWRLGCVRGVMAGLSLGVDCACVHLLAWRMITGVSNWRGSNSFKHVKSMRRKFL